MLLTRERLEEIQATFRGYEDEDGITFILEGQKAKYPCWDVWAKRIGFFKDSDGTMKDLETKDFLKAIEGKELTALIWKGWRDGEETYDDYDEWEDFARVIGVTRMVVISTKVPEIIAKRFDFFADEHGQSTASQLRRVVYDYVEEEWKEKAGDLIFREGV